MSGRSWHKIEHFYYSQFYTEQYPGKSLQPYHRIYLIPVDIFWLHCRTI
jgi:hypothetical protein